MIDAAVLIPYDPASDSLMLVLSTYFYPKPQLRGCYKAIGGVIEAGESPEEAVERELQEEFPWLADAAWLAPRRPLGVVEMFSSLGERTGSWYVYTVHTSFNPARFHAMRRTAAESTPHIVYRPRILKELVEPTEYDLREAQDAYYGRVRDDFAYPLPNCFPGMSAVVSFDFMSTMDQRRTYSIRSGP